MVNRDKTWHLWQHCVVVTVSSDREGVKYIQRGALSLGKYMLIAGILRGVNPYFCEYRTRGGVSILFTKLRRGFDRYSHF